jgi:hypothetical protein
VPLLTAQEIKQLGDEDVIGFHRRLPPFQANRMDWRRFGELEKRRQMPAPRLAALPALTTRHTPGLADARDCGIIIFGPRWATVGEYKACGECCNAGGYSWLE